MDIVGKFLELTNKTYPYGKESECFKYLIDGYQLDKHGNVFYKIGDSKTMFTSHLDTADDKQSYISHHFIEDFVMTDGTSILGADCKAGVVIMLNMIENKVPGLYYFFIGEEVGRIGSRALSNENPNIINNIENVISFDRRGYDSIITHQMGERCCSEAFAIVLSNMLNEYGFNYEPDNSGIVTDSYSFNDGIRNCTNISVGYFDEHSVEEMQNIVFLKNLADACIKIKWESL